MKYLERQHLLLLFGAPILCIAMMIIFAFSNLILGKTIGYIIGFCTYWLSCYTMSLYSANGVNGVKKIFSNKINKSNNMVFYLLAFVPCIATFFVIFKETIPFVGFQVLFMALLFALINGFFEEMFWRGVFNKVFGNNILLAFIYPSIFFGIWHIALIFAKGIVYQGGFASLIGGALCMGLLWGWIAYKTKSIKAVTAAHIITNFFAFTGLIYDNWFK